MGQIGGNESSYIPTTTENWDDTTIETTITPIEPTSVAPPKVHYLFSKGQWGGRDALNETKLKEPVRLVVIKHTKTATCGNITGCFQAVQDLQNRDMDFNKLPDIQYNFIIGGDGNIYEGRGWGIKNEQRNDSIDIAYIGDFNIDVPNEWQVAAGKFFVMQGILKGHLDSVNTKVVGHNQTEDTDSPGENLYREIVNWPYYSDEIIKNTFQKHNL